MSVENRLFVAYYDDSDYDYNVWSLHGVFSTPEKAAESFAKEYEKNWNNPYSYKYLLRNQKPKKLDFSLDKWVMNDNGSYTLSEPNSFGHSGCYHIEPIILDEVWESQ